MRRNSLAKEAHIQQPLYKINPLLERLGVLAGDWDVEVSNIPFYPDPSTICIGARMHETYE